MLKTALSALAFSLALAAAAEAAPPPDGPGGRPDGMFDRLDADGDGYLTESEVNARHKKLFEEADANRDGKVSREEMRAHMTQKREEMRERRFPDANGDGVVTRKEFEDAAGERFDELDADKNGKLTEDEIRRGRPR